MQLNSHFGPELSLGLALHGQWPERQFVLLKRANSGSTLAGDWVPGSHGYRALLEDVEVIRKANPDKRVVPTGLLWLQGEADAKDSEKSESYGTNINRLITQLRKDIDAPALAVVLVGLPGAGRKYQERVNSALIKTRQSLPGVSFVYNDRVHEQHHDDYDGDDDDIHDEHARDADDDPVDDEHVDDGDDEHGDVPDADVRRQLPNA